MTRQLADVECEIIHETDAAYKLRADNDVEGWVPKSICEVDDDDEENIVITMPLEFAISKGFV